MFNKFQYEILSKMSWFHFFFSFGTVGETNVQGEEVKKLDVLANELFINMLKSSYTVALLISEENETFIEVRTHKKYWLKQLSIILNLFKNLIAK